MEHKVFPGFQKSIEDAVSRTSGKALSFVLGWQNDGNGSQRENEAQVVQIEAKVLLARYVKPCNTQVPTRQSHRCGELKQRWHRGRDIGAGAQILDHGVGLYGVPIRTSRGDFSISPIVQSSLITHIYCTTYQWR